MDIGTVIYKLVDFHAFEYFDSEGHNTNPHACYPSRTNGHNLQSSWEIDESLRDASPKQCLDFLAEHDGEYKKDHSVVSAIYGTYHAQVNSHHTKLGFHMPLSIDVTFKRYVELGNPEEFELSLNAKVIMIPNSLANKF